MSLASLHDWFGDHIYRAILITSILEGLGLPIPSEVLFLPAIPLARQGQASLVLTVLLAALGNTVGGLIGFGVAFRAGPAFLQKVFRWLGIKPQALRKMEGFFAKYGQATVFLSRFVGFIRAATIYSAGVARMSPLRFTIYLVTSGLIWYTGWALLVARFQHRALHVLEGPGKGRFLYLVLLLLALLVLGRYLVRLYRTRRPSDP